jgi:hypothetical protein
MSDYFFPPHNPMKMSASTTSDESSLIFRNANSNEFEKSICEALGISPHLVRHNGVTVQLNGNEASARISIEAMLPKDLVIKLWNDFTGGSDD